MDGLPSAGPRTLFRRPTAVTRWRAAPRGRRPARPAPEATARSPPPPRAGRCEQTHATRASSEHEDVVRLRKRFRNTRALSKHNGFVRSRKRCRNTVALAKHWGVVTSLVRCQIPQALQHPILSAIPTLNAMPQAQGRKQTPGPARFSGVQL